jgi:probable HAF family extracellular repeat protein
MSHDGIGNHAFVWQEDTGMVDIHDKLDGVGSMPIEINNSGQIIGTYLKANGAWRAFVFDDDGRFRDLGISSESTAGCCPAAITDRGRAIAHMYEPEARKFFVMRQPRRSLSFLFDRRLRVLYLHKALPFETDKFIAYDMNNKGQIIASARKDKTMKWYLMTPVD